MFSTLLPRGERVVRSLRSKLRLTCSSEQAFCLRKRATDLRTLSRTCATRLSNRRGVTPCAEMECANNHTKCPGPQHTAVPQTAVLTRTRCAQSCASRRTFDTRAWRRESCDRLQVGTYADVTTIGHALDRLTTYACTV